MLRLHNGSNDGGHLGEISANQADNYIEDQVKDGNSLGDAFFNDSDRAMNRA